MKNRQSVVTFLTLALALSAGPAPAAELSAPSASPQPASMTAANLLAAQGNAQAAVNTKNAFLDEAHALQAAAVIPIDKVDFRAGSNSYIRIHFAPNESLDSFTIESGGVGGGSSFTYNRIDQSITYRYFPGGTPPKTIYPGDADYEDVFGYILSDLLQASGPDWQPYYVNEGVTDTATLRAAKTKTQQLYLLVAGLPKETRDKRGRVIYSETYDFASGLTVKSSYSYLGNKVVRSTVEKFLGDIPYSKEVVQVTLGGTHRLLSFYQYGSLYYEEASFTLHNGIKVVSYVVVKDPRTSLTQSTTLQVFHPITGKVREKLVTVFDSAGVAVQKIITVYNSKGAVIKEKIIDIPRS